MPLVPRCHTSGAPAANTNPVNTAHGRTTHNGTLLQNFILGHSTGFQDFFVTGNKLVTGSYTFFRALWVFGVGLVGCVTRLLTQLPTLPLCLLYMYVHVGLKDITTFCWKWVCMPHCSDMKYTKNAFFKIISLEQYYIRSLKGLKRVLHGKGLLQRSVYLQIPGKGV